MVRINERFVNRSEKHFENLLILVHSNGDISEIHVKY